ncbi:MAG: hypothetical protein MR507_02870 [Succinivibrio sp.]|nr:hypothetical protein [Succinivibrio sp.]
MITLLLKPFIFFPFISVIGYYLITQTLCLVRKPTAMLLQDEVISFATLYKHKTNDYIDTINSTDFFLSFLRKIFTGLDLEALYDLYLFRALSLFVAGNLYLVLALLVSFLIGFAHKGKRFDAIESISTSKTVVKILSIVLKYLCILLLFQVHFVVINYFCYLLLVFLCLQAYRLGFLLNA